MTRFGIIITALVAAAFAMIGLAFAQAPGAVDPTSTIQTVVAALQHHQWAAAVATGIVGFVAFCRWLAPKVHGKFGEWLNSTRASAALAILSGIGAAITIALTAGKSVNFAVVLGGAITGLTAIGGYNAFYDLLFPADKTEDVKPKLVMPKTAALLPLVFLPLLSVLMAVPGCKTAGGVAFGVCEIASLPQTLKDSQSCIEAALARPDFMTAVNGCKGLAKDQLICVVTAVTIAADGRLHPDGGATAASPVDINVATHGHEWLNTHKK